MAQQRNRTKESLVSEVATDQGGVVGLDQLRESGVSRWAAARGAKRGTLHRVHRGVYAVGHEYLERPAELRATLLACGNGAVISHGTAAALWGLSDRWPALIDVTVPVEAGRKLDGIRCRRCRFPQPEEITEHERVTCTTPARTLVDEAGRLGTPSLRRLVEQAAVRKRLDLDDCYRTIANARGRRGIRILRAILSDWDSGASSVPDVRSVFEARTLPRLLALGLPRPLVNHRLEIERRTLIPDFLWPRQKLIVETDGRETHETAAAFQRDRHRDQLLVAAGYRVVRITWEQMRDEPDAVANRIASACGS